MRGGITVNRLELALYRRCADFFKFLSADLLGQAD
jgi:hypothetical protein